MAFTDAQKATIRKYLGWSPRYAQVPEQLEHENAMNSIAAFPEQQTLCEAAIVKLDAHDALMDDVISRQAADAVGTIKLRGNDEWSNWRGVGRMLSGRLASLLGASIGFDYWSTTGPDRNASWSGFGGGDNAVRHG